MNNYFILEWNTTKDQLEPFGNSEIFPVVTYIGDAKAVWHLWYLLTKVENYKFVVVRNNYGQEIDMTQGYLSIAASHYVPSGVSTKQAKKLELGRQEGSLGKFVKEFGE